MSKITLEPNDSGAGTFSIVSPDSNTNRTLTLPDEAGKLLSTGNNDPAEVFKQSNILGTVSESGGVPTGAIIERDSNANGEYVKYADGTMICFISRFQTDRGGNTAIFGFWQFPIQFSDSHPLPVIHFTEDYDSNVTTLNVNDDFRDEGVLHLENVSREQTRVQLYNNSGGGSSDEILLFNITAIGRWY